METNTHELRFCPALDLRVDADGANRRISGHAAVFNTLSVDMGFREVIRPGAFAASLAKKPDVRFLINHDGLPLARTSSGTLKLSEDGRGLHFEAMLDMNDPDAQRIVPKVARRDVSNMSFAFRMVKDSWRVEGGRDIRELHEVDINDGDVSLVTYPAYKAADAAMRSYERWKAGNFSDAEMQRFKMKLY